MTYVLCDDGKWYDDPCWWGSLNGRWWFIVFDKDEPPEIVIAGSYGQDQVSAFSDEILTGIGIPFKLIGPAHVSQACSRCFPHDGQKQFRQAGSWFFQWRKPPMRPQYPPDARGKLHDFVHNQA